MDYQKLLLIYIFIIIILIQTFKRNFYRKIPKNKIL